MYTTPEFYAKIFTLSVVLYIVYTLWQLTRKLGGLFGQAIKPFSIGIIILSIETIDKVLEYFHADIVEMVLTPQGEECFHVFLKLIGLLFIAYGCYKIGILVKRSKKDYPKK